MVMHKLRQVMFERSRINAPLGVSAADGKPQAGKSKISEERR